MVVDTRLKMTRKNSIQFRNECLVQNCAVLVKPVKTAVYEKSISISKYEMSERNLKINFFKVI